MILGLDNIVLDSLFGLPPLRPDGSALARKMAYEMRGCPRFSTSLQPC